MTRAHRLSSLIPWIALAALAVAVGLAAWAIFWRKPDASAISEAQAEQVVLEQMEQRAAKIDGAVDAYEGAIVVKLAANLTDEPYPYSWYSHSPLAIWKYSGGSLSPATLDDLEQAWRAGDVYITYFSMQSLAASEIVVGIAGYSPVIDSSGFVSGGYGVTWRLAKEAAGWRIVAYEHEVNWDSVAP